MMKYQPEKFTMWDAWCIEKDGEMHLFHLQFPRPDSGIKRPEDWGWGHAVSRDMVHWEQKPDILCPKGRRHDSEIRFTGSTVLRDGVYYMFYVMRDGDFQRIGAAMSKDLYEWKEYEGNPVLTPDPRFFNAYMPGEDRRCTLAGWQPIVDCRDMLVRPDGTGGWYGYFVAAADLGGYSPVGVIGVAYSTDLLHWDQRGIAFRPRWAGIVEMIDVFEMDGRFFMTLLTSSAYGSLHCFSDDNVCRGEIYAVSSSPEGPFVDDPADNTFIGGPDDTGYSCRTVDFRGQRRLIYVDSNYGSGTLSLPKTVRAKGGRLRPYYADDLLPCLRKRELDTSDFRLPQNSFAWPSRGGEWRREGSAFVGVTAPGSWQACLFENSLPAANVEAECLFSWDCSCFGFVFWGRGDDSPAKKLAVAVEPGKNRLHVTKPYAWQLRDFRAYDFGGRKSAHLRVILADNTVEVYVDDELVVNCGCQNPGESAVGLFADDGSVRAQDLHIWEIDGAARRSQ